MRADMLYETALALLGEDEYSCDDYTHLKFRIINQALAGALFTYNTIRLSQNKEPIEKFETVVKDSDEIPVCDNMAREVLAPAVGALLCADHDREKANVLAYMAQTANKKYSKANFLQIENLY